jgi:PAS domain S-box-containing protein
MIVLPDYRVRQREHLLDIARAITEQLDLNEVLRRVLAAAAAMLSGELSLIALRDEHDKLYIPAAYGVEAADLPYFDDLLHDLESIGFDRERVDLRTRQLAKKLNLPLRQVVALPLKMSEEPMGVLLVFRTFSGLATDNDRQILQSFADQAAIAVHNARLYEAVAREKQHLAAVLEHSADGIMILDADRAIIGFNRALSLLTGWQAEAALGRQDQDVLRWVDQDIHPALESLQADSAKPQSLYLEGEIERLDGLAVSVGITYALLSKDDGRPAGYIANVRDISHFRKAAEMKNTFISVISHELKTPVALIKGYADTYRRQDAAWASEDYREALGIIEEEADRLKELIDNLLAASKLQAEGMRLAYDDVSLPRLAERVIERFQTQSKQHRLRLDFPPDFPPIRGDEIRLRQVLENLVSNAIKYSPNGGDIWLRGQVLPDEILVQVQDQGIGIPPNQLELIFERFYRVDDGLSRVTQGTGLGLYLARAVIEAHRGRIWAESSGTLGTTFCFSLPR